MTSLETESPVLAVTKTGAVKEADLLVILAAWLLRFEHRRLEQNIPAGWDAAVSLQLDRLTDIRERLAEYLDKERRRL